ncbi:MAG TPA: DUF5615 family PIN-like protein [Blastocatellia bacterium]|nr:DUF5615 family PIN-like protein [Blastocatellia bacterium]
MNFLIDENMPRSLAGQVRALGFTVQDARDIGLRGHSDGEVFHAAIETDAIIITRDRGFTVENNWPPAFTAGVILVNLPDRSSASEINAKVVALVSKRIPESLVGCITILELHRALSRVVRRRH